METVKKAVVMSERGKKAKEAPPPEIETIRALTKRYPRRDQWPALVGAVKAGMMRYVFHGDPERELQFLAQCWDAWVIAGYNPTNYAWVTSWFVNGAIKHTKNGHKQQDVPVEPAPWLTPDGIALVIDIWGTPQHTRSLSDQFAEYQTNNLTW